MSHLYLLGVATLTLTSAGFAGSDTNADLQARLEAAETRINELSAATNNNWLNDTRSDEIRSLVHDVLADADNRASLQGSGSTAGYNGGFTVGSADGNWSLKINGLLQTSWSNVDDEPSNEDGWGFNTPNAWINMSGKIAGDYSYDIRYNWNGSTTSTDTSYQGLDAAGNEVGINDPNLASLRTDVDTTTNSGQGKLEWANGSMNLGDGWDLRMGTFKVATSREALIDDQNLLGLDGWDADGGNRYTVGNGVSLEYAGDQMRFWGQVTNYDGNNATTNDSRYNFTGRLEYMVEGTWGQFDEFTSVDGGAAGTLLGISYTRINSNDDDDDDKDSTLIVDAQLQFGGSNLYVSYGDHDDNVGNNSNKNTKVQYGMYLNSDWEVYGQYENNDAWTGDAVYSVGLNNYWAGQNARWTTQVNIDDHTNNANGDRTTITTQLQFYF
jgi:hypothetical protein